MQPKTIKNKRVVAPLRVTLFLHIEAKAKVQIPRKIPSRRKVLNGKRDDKNAFETGT